MLDPVSSADEFVLQAFEKLQEAAAFVREYTGKQMGQMKAYYDASVRPTEYREGQKVLLYDPHKHGQLAKWQVSWRGPFLISRKLNDSNYALQKLVGRKPFVAHTDFARFWMMTQLTKMQSTTCLCLN